MPDPGGIREILGRIRHRKPQPVFCPRCESSDIGLKPSFGIPTEMYRCNNCGYEGAIVFELEKDDASTEDREAL